MLVSSSKTQTKKGQRRDCPLQVSRTLGIFECHKSLLIETLTGSSAPAPPWTLKNNCHCACITGSRLIRLPCRTKWFVSNPSNRVSAICWPTDSSTPCVSQAQMQSSCACTCSEVLDPQRLYVSKQKTRGEDYWGLWHLPSCMRATTVLSPSLPRCRRPFGLNGKGAEEGHCGGQKAGAHQPSTQRHSQTNSICRHHKGETGIPQHKEQA